jgi:hypothetical protein
MNMLRKISNAEATTFMENLVPIGNHFISMYLDHDVSIKNMSWDDVAAFLVTEKPTQTHAWPCQVDDPPVPIQVVYEEEVSIEEIIEGLGSRSKQKFSMNKEDEKEASGEGSCSDEEEDSNYDILDSEYEIEEDDNDLHANHVEDEEGIGNKRQK